MENAALIIVDVQNDFLPAGNLAVPDSDKILPVINKLMEQFAPDRVFLTLDSHPENHGSFASQHKGKKVFDMIKLHGIKQVLWPDHCVRGTRGAQLSSALEVPEDAEMVYKGMNPKYDSYSGFKDAGGQETGLLDELNDKELEAGSSVLYICGLATDYCVKATAIDAVNLGFTVKIVIDACRGVAPDTTEQALAEMDDVGIQFVKSDDLKVAVSPV
jgi:nicotinamidase/pyrazinamidase